MRASRADVANLKVSLRAEKPRGEKGDALDRRAFTHNLTGVKPLGAAGDEKLEKHFRARRVMLRPRVVRPPSRTRRRTRAPRRMSAPSKSDDGEPAAGRRYRASYVCPKPDTNSRSRLVELLAAIGGSEQ